MAGEVAHVESPEDGPLDLCSQLASRLVEVGVVPQVAERAGEAAVTVEQRRSVGDRAPPVGVVLGVEGEVDPDVFAPVAGRRVPRPGAGDHERGAGGDRKSTSELQSLMRHSYAVFCLKKKKNIQHN